MFYTHYTLHSLRATNVGVNLVGARVYSPQTMMTDVLTKLLAVVVADPLAEIRLATLREFNTDFHKQLALSENIQVLYLAEFFVLRLYKRKSLV